MFSAPLFGGNFYVREDDARVLNGTPEEVREVDGSFALLARNGKTVRLARSMDRPMRYFLAKRHEGPALAYDREDVEPRARQGLLEVRERRAGDRAVDRLGDFGCDEAQGFYFAHPQPAGEIVEWLRAMIRYVDQSLLEEWERLEQESQAAV